MTKKHYLTLTDGTIVRVQLNMNAIGEFTSMTGKELFDLSAKPDVNLLRSVAWCAVREGQLCDGHEFTPTEVEFGRLVDFKGITEFSKILASQISTSAEKKSKPTIKTPARG